MKNKIILVSSFIVCASGCGKDSLYISKTKYDFTSEPHERFITSYNTIEPVTEGILTWVKSTKPENPDPNITFTPITRYKNNKSYLFYKTNGLYNDSSAFFTNTYGLPNGDKLSTSSEQQAGALTSSLIQLAAKALASSMGISSLPAETLELTNEDQSEEYIKEHNPCNTVTLNVANISGFTQHIDLTQHHNNEIDVYGLDPDPKNKDNKMKCYLGTITWSIEGIKQNAVVSNLPIEHTGFWVYDPTPAVFKLATKEKAIIWSNVFETYSDGHWEDPERGFWTKPTDTYSLNNGVLVGHAYNQQSPIKTVVDFIFAPVQLALPGVTQSTETTTSEGKAPSTKTSSSLSFK